MLQNIVVTNYLGEELTLSMINPAESGFFIKSIDGLGPVKANINTVDVVSIDGSLFNSSRLDKRNIVITLGAYDVEESVESLRQRSYAIFAPKRKIKLNFITDNKNVYINGFVESNEPDIFQKQVTMKVSIICPQPFFRDIYDNSYTYKLTDELETPLSYDGDSETGLIFSYIFSGNTSNVKITSSNGNFFSINDTYLKKIPGLSNGFIENDELIISTVINEKTITLKRNNVTYNILNAMDRNSKWLKIGKGRNTFTFTANTSSEDGIVLSVTNPILYDGI